MFQRAKLSKIYNTRWTNKQRILWVFLISFLAVFPVFSQNINKLSRVVIDPGHGGKDPGNPGTGSFKTTEKHITLDISLLLGNYIKASFPDVEVIYTRTNNDQYPTLNERCNLANDKKADLFISIHCDAFKKPEANGSSVYVMGMSKLQVNLDVAMKENSVIYLEDDYQQHYEGFEPNSPESYIVFSLTQHAFVDQSLQFAEEVEQEMAAKTKRKSRGVKQAPFYVISRSNMPSILVECGFLTNPNEEKYLNSQQGKEDIASSIFKAFKSFKESIEFTKTTPNHSAIEQNTPIEHTNEVRKEQQKITTSSEIVNPSNIIFKVQLGIYQADMRKSKEFQGLEVEQEVVDGLFKYYIGNTAIKQEADNLRKKMVDLGFDGAFVIALKEGKRISIQEALNLQKK